MNSPWHVVEGSPSVTAPFCFISWNILDDEYCMSGNVTEVCAQGQTQDVCKWENRLPLIINEIEANEPDIIALQEVSPHMFVDLLQMLQSRGYEGVCDGEVWTVVVFWRKPWKQRIWQSIAEEKNSLRHRLTLDGQHACDQQASYFFRTLAIAFERPDGEKLLLVNVHTDWRDEVEVRERQLQRAELLGDIVCEAAGWEDTCMSKNL